ncbi:myosin-11-like [Manduca sexta]|uniref:myosin-11-like n=1 Tax=Manduca sexta TaxID=7130 RepID=UPI0018902A1F|nr:myosin-11-like [Manduca sexta]
MNLKIQELKLLTDQLKDKETEIEILNEDINAFHEEIATLKEQLKMASRSPSPRKSGDEKKVDRQASSDKKQLVKIRKQISLLQHELDFNKKELNDKAFELAKAKLDVTELKNTMSQATKHSADKESANLELRQQMETMQVEIQELKEEKQRLEEQLEFVTARLREECNVSELRAKLRQKSERCEDLENELQDLKELVERLEVCSRETGVERGERAVCARSPTAELERAVRDQLHYSHQLDDTLVDQILSASSDEHEDIPPLALNTSKSSSSIHSTSSDRINRLKSENEKLQMQVDNLESRLKDKDALITELNRVREKLSTESQTNRLRYEAERDNAGRLRLLLHAHKDTADTLQNQDSNMIQILKRRLESAMQSEVELQQQAQRLRARLAALEHQLASAGHRTDSHSAEIENMERLKGEVSLLKSKLEVERSRCQDLQAMLDHSKLQAQRELDARADACNALRNELAEIKRQKHDTSVELVRAKELLSTQSATIAELEKKLTSTARQKPINDALTEIQTHKSELAREIATLKRCLADTASPELHTLRSEKQQLIAKVERLEAELQQSKTPDEKEQAIRYLHGRCLRLESYRKALVWQKRYLQRVLEGYTQLEKNLCLPSSAAPPRSRGKNRFRCVARAVVAALRARFLVRRRGAVRALSANALLRADTSRGTKQDLGQGLQTPTKLNVSTAPRQSLRRDLAMGTPGSPHLDFIRRSPYPNSPRDDPFILSHSSPRGAEAGAYLSKLELVGRCLQRAVHSRDVP